MSSTLNISGMIPVGQAAELLGLSSHQVCVLVHSGELSSVRVGARAMLIDSESALRYRQMRQGKGRPLEPVTAFAALGLLSGESVDGLSCAQRSRLKKRLGRITPEELVWQCRKRKRTKRYRCSASFLKELGGRVALSGTSALGDVFDLTSDDSRLEGYASESSIDQLVYDFFLQEDPRGNAVLHSTKDNPWSGNVMPVGVVAADLAESLNTRERSAGLVKLKELLDEFNLQNK